MSNNHFRVSKTAFEARRREQGNSQKALAQAVQVTQRTIQMLEEGRAPEFRIAVQCAVVLKRPIEQLFAEAYQKAKTQPGQKNRLTPEVSEQKRRTMAEARAKWQANINAEQGQLPTTRRPPQKQWMVTSPSGVTETVLNLSKYCREHGLTPTIFSAVGRGKHRQHKGYQCKLVINSEN